MLEKLKLFKQFAERAARLEKDKHWGLASQHWEHAAACARTQTNRDWAQCRAEVCRRRLSPET